MSEQIPCNPASLRSEELLQYLIHSVRPAKETIMEEVEEQIRLLLLDIEELKDLAAKQGKEFQVVIDDLDPVDVVMAPREEGGGA